MIGFLKKIFKKKDELIEPVIIEQIIEEPVIHPKKSWKKVYVEKEQPIEEETTKIKNPRGWKKINR